MNFWAITIDNGDATHVILDEDAQSDGATYWSTILVLTLMTEKKPPFTVRLISSSDLAPLMMAMDVKNTEWNIRILLKYSSRGSPIVWMGAMKILLANIWAALAVALVFPAKNLCKMPTR
jgi:hypothetical protein